MTTTVFCTISRNDNHFYLKHDGKNIYLFSQNRKKGVEEFYGRGVILDKAIHHGKSKNDISIHKTKDKLITYIRYIEQEYGIIVFEKTRKKSVVGIS